jgi:methionyl-tRNA synthetase
MAHRFRLCYELDGFSLSRAADALVTHVARLERDAAEASCAVDVGGVYHELGTLLTAGAPILVDLAEAVRRQTGQALTFTAAERPVSTVETFALPPLATAP